MPRRTTDAATKGFTEQTMDKATHQAADTPRFVQANGLDHGAAARAPVQTRRQPAGPARRPAPASQGSFIIELFGPPSAGKTTLAAALAKALEAQGLPVQLESSARPAERGIAPDSGNPPHLSAAFSRAAKLIGALSAQFSGTTSDPVTAGLLKAMPPKSWIRTVRIRRYLTNLHRSWRAAQTSNHIVIFDQGYMSALCSLALLSDPTDLRAMAGGLDLAPAPDLLVRLDAPRQVLEARLADRIEKQSPLERLFEHDITTSLKKLTLAATVDAMLLERQQQMMRFSCLDSAGLDAAVTALVDAIITQHRGLVA
jgi:thymidylate kinase